MTAASGRWLYTEGVGIVAAPVRGPVSLSLNNGFVDMPWTSDAAGEGVWNDYPVTLFNPMFTQAGVAGTPLDWGAATTKAAIGSFITLPNAGNGDWFFMSMNDLADSSFGTNILSPQFRPVGPEIRVYCSIIPSGDNYYGFDASGIVGGGPMYINAVFDSGEADPDDRIKLWVNGAFLPRLTGADVPLNEPLEDVGVNAHILYGAANEANIFVGASDLWIGGTPTAAELTHIESVYAVNHDIDPEEANPPAIWFGTNA